MDWKTLLKQGKDGLEKGTYKQSQQVLSRAFDEASKEQKPTDLEMAELKLALGRANRLIGAFDDAKIMLDDAAATFKGADERITDYVSTLNQLGLLHQDLADLDESKRVLNEALAIEREHFGEETERVGDIINSLGLTYWRQGDDTKALDFLREAMATFAKTVGEEHEKYAESLDGAGIIYQRLREADKALDCHVRSLEIRKRCLGETHPDVGYSLYNLANAKAMLGDKDEFEETTKHVIEIFSQAFGENAPETAMIMGNLGTFYIEQKRYDEALEISKRALEVREAAFGTDHPRLATNVHNIAVALTLSGKREEAKGYSKRARALLTQKLENEGWKDVNNIISLADSLNSSGDTAGAQELLQETMERIEKELGEENPNFLQLLEMFAIVAGKNFTQIETMKDCYLRILRIKTKQHGRIHPELASTLKHLAFCYQLQGDASTQRILTNRAKVIEFKFAIEDPEQAAIIEFMTKSYESDKSSHSLRMLTSTLRLQGKADEADALEREFINDLEVKHGNESLEFAKELSMLAIGMGHEESIAMLERILSIQEKHPDADPDEVENTLESLNIAYSVVQNFERNEETLLKLLDHVERRNGKKHWSLRHILQKMVVVLESQKKTEEAERYKARFDQLPEPSEDELAEDQERRMKRMNEILSSSMGSLTSMLAAFGSAIGDSDTLEAEGLDIASWADISEE
ncbi:MAG: tetratricopeptide repeat protein [Cyanobacteria bacterium]|nr:tetratricopeptide repeat protein [Cyanobacteriota bacterium]